MKAKLLCLLLLSSTSFLGGCDEQPIELPPTAGIVGPTGATGPTGPQGPAGPMCLFTDTATVVVNDGVRFCFGTNTHGCEMQPSACIVVPNGHDGEPGSPGEPGQPGTPGMNGASCIPTSIETRTSTVPDMEKFCVNFNCSAAPTQRQLCVDRPIAGGNSCQQPGTIVDVRTSTMGGGVPMLCVALSCNGQRVSEFSCGPIAPPPGCVPGEFACDCGSGGFCGEDLVCRGTFCDWCPWGTDSCPCNERGECNAGFMCVDRTSGSGTPRNTCEPRPRLDAGLVDSGQPDAAAPTDGGPTTGTEGGPCYGNDTCNTGLSCLPVGMSNICVRLPDGGVVMSMDAGVQPDAAPVFPDAAAPDAMAPADGGPPTGTEGGDCYGNGTCNLGLTCIPVAGRPNLCVRLPDAGVMMNPDAGVQPDAAPVFPDAQVFPDAAPVFPDAAPRDAAAPDAAAPDAAAPDAQVFPDAAPVFPDAAPTFPDATAPDAVVVNPDASAPDATPLDGGADAGVDGGTADAGTMPTIEVRVECTNNCESYIWYGSPSQVQISPSQGSRIFTFSLPRNVACVAGVQGAEIRPRVARDLNSAMPWYACPYDVPFGAPADYSVVNVQVDGRSIAQPLPTIVVPHSCGGQPPGNIFLSRANLGC